MAILSIGCGGLIKGELTALEFRGIVGSFDEIDSFVILGWTAQITCFPDRKHVLLTYT